MSKSCQCQGHASFKVLSLCQGHVIVSTPYMCKDHAIVPKSCNCVKVMSLCNSHVVVSKLLTPRVLCCFDCKHNLL